MKCKPCWDATIDGIKCLETDDEIGYFKSQGDRRLLLAYGSKRIKSNLLHN
jgi:hypothetical protein